jgi:hypothetical protein
MAKLTMLFGVLLIFLSVGAYLTGVHYWHTFIPSIFGLLLLVFGLLANTPDPKRRMIFMHIAVTVGLLGFLGTIPGIIGVVQMAAGHSVLRPEAAKVQALMGAICLFFVLLCVRSFIAARRSRVTEA